MELLQQACSAGDSRRLEALLSDESYQTTALGQERQPLNKCLPPTRPNIQILLEIAAKSGSLTCVQMILTFGRDHNVPYQKFVTRWEVFAALKSGENAILKEFVKVWPDVVNLEMGIAGQPLMQTLFRNNFELCEHLLNHGADTNAVHGPDTRPGVYLRYAAEKLALQYTTPLLEHGAHVAQTGAIRMAAEKGRLDVLKVLIENGGDVNERLQPDAGFFIQKQRFQKASETPLHVATEFGQRDVVVWLLEQGADAEIGDLSGKTPRELAKEKGNEELVRVLEGNVNNVV